MEQLDLQLSEREPQHGSERSDYVPCNRLLHYSVALPAWYVVHLLDCLEELDSEAFNYADEGGLTLSELREIILKSVKIGVVVGG